MDFYVGFHWFAGQIVRFFDWQKKRWQIIVLVVTCMFCTVIQSHVNDCFFLEKKSAKIAAKTLRCDLAACMFRQKRRARHIEEQIHFGSESTFEKIANADAKLIAFLF